MSTSNPINDLDHHGAQAILTAGEAVSTLNPIIWVIEQLKHLPIDEREEVDIGIISPVDWIKDGAQAFGKYHGRVLKQASQWSLNVRNTVSWASSRILYPLSFGKVGRAIQHSLSYNILGSVAQSITFCVLQILHVIPYLLTGSFLASTVTLYQTDPIALTALFAGGMLTTQLWFIYRLVKTVEATKRTFEQKADDLVAAINLVQIVKNTFWSGLDIGARAIRWSVSWIPTKSAPTPPTRS